MRLNIGAGHRRIPGWTGVDLVQREGTDIIANACCIPLPNGSVEEIMAVHLVEHMYAWEVPAALNEWFRLLSAGGKLILEMPDLMKACRNIAEDYKGKRFPDQQGLWAIYGDDRSEDPLMMHKAGWWFARLRPLVQVAGFTDISEHPTVFHPVGKERRDFRLEAIKP